MAKEGKTALQLANAIRDQLGRDGSDLKIGVFFDKAEGWKAKIYGSSAWQRRVDKIAQGLRQRFDFDGS